jgi:hypothetical protein
LLLFISKITLVYVPFAKTIISPEAELLQAVCKAFIEFTFIVAALVENKLAKLNTIKAIIV